VPGRRCCGDGGAAAAAGGGGHGGVQRHGWTGTSEPGEGERMR
jgi:hypothetical protein